MAGILRQHAVLCSGHPCRRLTFLPILGTPRKHRSRRCLTSQQWMRQISRLNITAWLCDRANPSRLLREFVLA